MLAQTMLNIPRETGGDSLVKTLPVHDIYVFITGFLVCAIMFLFFRYKKVVNTAKEAAPAFDFIKPDISRRMVSLNDMLQAGLAEVHNPERFVILVFGPAVIADGSRDSTVEAIGRKRRDIRQNLEQLKFTVFYGEDIEGAEGDDFLRSLHISLKEKLLGRRAHAILILASSVGSAAEVGIFSQDPELCKKMIIAIHEEHSKGFVAQGACKEAETYGAKLFVYSQQDLISCQVQTRLVSEALRLYQGLLSRSLIWQPKF